MFVNDEIVPFLKVLAATIETRREEVQDLAKRSGVVLTHQEMERKGKHLMEAFMKKWLPAGDAMLEMITIHLPSPLTAQKYRTELLYEGPKDDEAVTGIFLQ